MLWIIWQLFRLAIRIAPFAAVGLGGLALYTQYVFQESFYVTWSRMLKPQIEWQKKSHPSLGPAFDFADGLLAGTDPRDIFGPIGENPPIVRPSSWKSTIVGPQVGAVGRSAFPAGGIRMVSTVGELTAAVGEAAPGTVITVAPGTYDFVAQSIEILPSGTADRPITLRADRLGAVTLHFNMQEGLHVQGSYWAFENLIIEGTCRQDDTCEHAFHIVGPAVGTRIRNNWVSNFNSPVKVNGSPKGYPDNGAISNNAFVNDRPRQTGNPVTFLDIVAANGWVVEGNFIADFAKLGDNKVSYGAFFKGAGSDNIFERNLVKCEWRHHGGIRIGFSFGGGGTTDDACRDRKCAQESSRGIMRSNIIMDCPNDVGVYLNKSAGTLIHNNLILNTRGIDVRFPVTEATAFNNVVDGRILTRDEATFTGSNNVTSVFDAALDRDVSRGLYINPRTGDLRATDPEALLDKGAAVPDAVRDFCGLPYQPGSHLIGPFQYGPNIGCTPQMP